MTENEWLRVSMYHRIDWLEDDVSNNRRLRLFACACCRRAWELLRLPTARRIVELAESYADGEVGEADLQAANDPAYFPDMKAQYRGQVQRGEQLSRRILDAISAARRLASPTFITSGLAYLVFQDTSRDPAYDYLPESEIDGIGGPPGGVRPDDVEIGEKEKLLRDIFGNPFRPVSMKPEWRTPRTIALAEQMYKTRDFTAMPILADALRDAGCENEDILSHCRCDGPHVRGCWVVDLILEKV